MQTIAQDLKQLRSQIDKTAVALTKKLYNANPTEKLDISAYIEKCDDQLLYLRMNLGRLKSAVADAAAPIGALLLPVVNRAVRELATLTSNLGAVLTALIGTVTGTDALADGTDRAASSTKALASSAKSARRTLAGFDQLERLGASSGSTVSATAEADTPSYLRLTADLQTTAARLLGLLEPLRSIDLAPLTAALDRLGAALQKVFRQLGGILEWVWLSMLAPMLAWIAETLAPTLADVLTAALGTIIATLTPLLVGLQSLWEALQPITSFIGQTLNLALQGLKTLFCELTAVFTDRGPQIAGVLRNIGQVATQVWSVIGPVLTALSQQWSTTFAAISRTTAQVVGYMLDALYGVTEFLSGAFTGQWKRAWEGLKYMLKGVINAIIGMLNTMLSAITGALNGIIRAANALRFTLPDWLGGKSFGLNIKTVSTPQIPYLAQGAVLPANKPFLAMVGDQRHGTNVEAPLSLIQDAMRQVTAEQSAATAAALEASVGVQREILSAVLGIHIGDATIAQAVDRYRTKMSIIQG